MAFGLGSSRVIFTLAYVIARLVLGLLVVLFRRPGSAHERDLRAARRRPAP
jgi:hypothetical protein